MYTKPAGGFRKIKLAPHKSKIRDALHAAPDDDATWGDAASIFEIEAAFDFDGYFG